MRIKVFFIFFIVLSFTGITNYGYAQDFLFYDDLQKFKSNNPDGKKYEFVNDYIDSLDYLHLAKDRKISDEEKLTVGERINKMIDNLVLDNLNLRVSRNILKKHKAPFNGLMLKATDLYIKMCNEQIALNNEERKKLTVAYRALQDEENTFNQTEFVEFQERLSAERKESSKKLLEASYLVTKVLISDKEDEYGELVYLGITSSQRRDLLRKLDAFQGPGYRGEIRSGQSFLEASVVTLRQNLEDYTWATLDEL